MAFALADKVQLERLAFYYGDDLFNLRSRQHSSA
jgi:hypothetical protein